MPVPLYGDRVYTQVPMGKGSPGVRYAEVERETNDTRVQVVLDLDGGTKADISTGVPFFDKMLELLAFHSQVDLGIKAEGNLEIDDHILVEDVGICVGKAIREALRETEPVVRYGSNHTPMDDALTLVAIDISGRGQLVYDVHFRWGSIGTMSTDSVHQFFRALAQHAGITVHLRLVAGDNDHHICESLFKGFGRALCDATTTLEHRQSGLQKGRD